MKNYESLRPLILGKSSLVATMQQDKYDELLNVGTSY